jgi:hypothetical protein
LGDLTLGAYVAVRSTLTVIGGRLATDERGEGVISAAIAVLIMAFLGAAMWLVFKEVFDSAGQKTAENVDQIGQ